MIESSSLAGIKGDILDHARREGPNEACGLIVRRGNKTAAIQCRNTSANPLTEWQLDPDDLEAAEDSGAEILGFYHTHPNERATPSEGDKYDSERKRLPYLVMGWPCDEEKASGVSMEDCVTWELYTPNGEPWPLERRPFIHGILDCYSLVRDWYKQTWDLDLPDFHRPDNWWDTGGDLYRDHFAACGFEKIDISEIQFGDALLIQLRADVPNHAAVYVGDGMMIHHAPHRLSGLQPYVANFGEYAKHTWAVLRHKSRRQN